MLKEIPIADLRVGMFITKLDISWIKSPFISHKRTIKSKNDIELLKKSGVKIVQINLNRSIIEEKTVNNSDTDSEKEFQIVQDDSTENVAKDITIISSKVVTKGETKEEKQNTLLSDEIKKVVLLKNKAINSFNKINNLENDEVISVEDFDEVIQDTISSLFCNSQALLTIMHIYEYEKVLFSHSFNVLTIALSMAIKLEIDHESLNDLGTASLMHDIGWTKLPLDLLTKNSNYDKKEFSVVKNHPILSNILISKTCKDSIRNIMLNHHERLDGSGYPRGLKAEQLGTLDNILILANYYDELIFGLSGYTKMVPYDALKLIYKESIQGKFDKELVNTLVKILGIFPVSSAVKLSSGEKAVVINISENTLKPIVNIFYTSDGNPLPTAQTVNLLHDKKDRKIMEIININKKSDPLKLLKIAKEDYI